VRLAIVTPWYGEDLTGGAERLAWELSHGLQRAGHNVTVLTTCARSFLDPWDKNYHSPGTSSLEGVEVARFRVDRINTAAFREINRRLLATPESRLLPGAPVLDEHGAAVFARDNIVSSALLAELARSGATYEAIVFLPYLYGTTLRGWQVVRERAVIVPCLHDEAYAYLEPVATMMRGAPLLLFNSVGEFELARRIYGPSIASHSCVVGSGVQPLADAVETRAPIGNFIPEDSDYIFYLGRQMEGKNIALLTEAFRRFRHLEPASPLRLVLAGEGAERTENALGDVVNLGRIDDAAKARLLRAMRALAQPSKNESFSRTMIEAWYAGKPVIVHADCVATAGALDATHGGWQARDVAGWQRVLHVVASTSDADLREIGSRGTAYAREIASWPRVLERYQDALATRLVHAAALRDPRPIVHVLPRAAYGDAVTNYALQISEALRLEGHATRVVASEIDEPLRGIVHAGSTYKPEDALTIGYLTTPSDAATLSDLGVRGPIAAAIFDQAKFDEILASCREARIDAAGVVPPPFFGAQRWNVAPDPTLLGALRDGRVNLLAVGPIEPASHLIEIVDVFSHYLALDFGARLSLVGPAVDAEYADRLHRWIERTGLEHRILVPGVVSQPAMAAFLTTADVAISHRERYATGMSLLEAMEYGVPLCVLANQSSRDVMGTAGILVADAGRPIELAALWRVLATDQPVRLRVIAGQRSRAAEFDAERALATLSGLFANVKRAS